MHRAAESAGDHEYLDLFFAVGAWAGTPSIGEPAKCSELVWATADQPPVDTVEFVRAALNQVVAGTQTLLTNGPDDGAYREHRACDVVKCSTVMCSDGATHGRPQPSNCRGKFDTVRSPLPG